MADTFILIPLILYFFFDEWSAMVCSNTIRLRVSAISLQAKS